MDSLLHDLGGALRGIRTNKSFTAIAVLCLSLAIGANTAVFSIVESTFLRPLPFENPDQLVSVRERDARTGLFANLSYPHFLTLRDQSPSFDALEAYSGQTIAVGDERAGSELVSGQLVSAGLFPMLGVEPQIGRGLSPTDDHIGAPRTVLISDGLWRRRYGGDQAIVGRVVNLNSQPHEVVGVMPPGFKYPESSDLWIPVGLVLEPSPLEPATVAMVGRRKASVSEDRLSAELAALWERTRPVPSSDDGAWALDVRSLSATIIGSEERLITAAMMGAVTFLLLLACANVASLLLVRASSREAEFALRAALGAGRGRLIQQLLVESVLLSAMAGIVAVPLAALALRVFSDTIPASDPFPFFVTFALSGPTLFYTSAIALLTGIAFGLTPAFAGSQARPSEALKADTRGSGMSARRARTLSALVVTEIAVAMTLLVGASLFVRTFLGLNNVDLGYDPARIMTMRLYLSGDEYGPLDARLRAVIDIQDRLSAVPGIEYATISDLIPLEDDGGSTVPIEVDGAAVAGRNPTLFYAGVFGDWLKTLDVAVTAGRDFDAEELRRSAPVALINETAARSFWPDGDALGRRFRFVSDSTGQWFSVIGVIPDIRTVKLDESDPTPPSAFLPISTVDTRDLGVMLRTSVPPASVANAARGAIAAIDSDVPTYKVRSMEEVKWLSFWMYALWGGTFVVFGGVALLLAAIGVYGVISHGVRERTHEIGVRVALGARRSSIVGLVLGQGARLTGIGLALGLISAIALGRVVESLLIGVSVGDPLTYLGALLFLGTMAGAASLVPALRAASGDAVAAMRR